MSSTRDIRLWTTGAVVDTVGDAAFLAAISWVAVHAEGIPPAVVIAMGSIPRVLMLVGGALGDRWGLIRVTNYTLAARIGLALLLGLTLIAAEEPIPAWPVAAIALLFGFADALHMPAMGSMVRVLTPDQTKLTRAQARVTWRTMLAEAVGPVLLGAVLTLGYGAPGWLCAVLFGAALACFIKLRARTAPPARSATLGQDLREGVRLLAWPKLRVVLLLFAVMNITTAPSLFVGIPMQAREFDWGAGVFGVAAAAFFVGGAIAASTVSAKAEEAEEAHMQIAFTTLALSSVVLVVMGFAEQAWLVVACAVGLGLLVPTAATVLKPAILAQVPHELAGRVTGMAQFAVFVGIPFGHVLFGWVADGLGFQAAGIVMAGLLALGLMASGALHIRSSRGATTRALGPE